MLGALTLLQREKKSNVDKYFKNAARTKESSLESFIEPEEGLERLLRSFMDAERLKRALTIKDDELTIQQETDDGIKAVIRDYHIVIDLKNRVILHDCADWSRMLSNKQFCKHVGKLMLSLNREKASNILRQIRADKESWQFNSDEMSHAKSLA